MVCNFCLQTLISYENVWNIKCSEQKINLNYLFLLWIKDETCSDFVVEFKFFILLHSLHTTSY